MELARMLERRRMLAKRAKMVLIILGLAILFVFDDVLIVTLVHELRILPGKEWAFALALTVLFAANALFALAVYRIMKTRPVSGKEGMIGEAGKALTSIHEDGTVSVHGEIWQAQSQSPIPQGSRVIVEAIEGLKLTVRRS